MLLDKLRLIAMLAIFALLTVSIASANQVGVNFSEDAIGALGDYQKNAWGFMNLK